MQKHEGIVERYESLPEWLRWIICWPISIVLAVVAWWLLLLIHGDVLLDFGVQIAHPVVVQVVFLSAIWFTVPRGKLGFLLMFIILRSLVLVFFVVVTPLLLFDVLPMTEETPMNWEHYWAPFIGEALTLVASIANYRVLRDLQSES